MTDVLTDIELELIFFIERYHASNGVAPTKAQVENRFTGLAEDWFADFVGNSMVQKSFTARGIIYPPMEDALSPEQMHAVSVMSDLVDRRSDEKKLRDLGITTRQWSTWLQDDNFAGYLRDRSELMVRNSVHEMHRGLMKGVRNGNVASVKLAYELTGRYRPDQEAQVDVRRILHTFIEVIQRYVQDPIVLHKIAMDLSNAATADSYANGLSNQMMSGAITARSQTVQSSVVPNLMAPKFEELNE